MISHDDNNLHVSIIIPTHNRGDLLSSSIESILVQKADGFNYEIIVVDNNSTDQTASLIADKIRSNGHTLRYVFEPQLGLVHGRHRGAREARGDLLVFCDDDIIACSGWLQSVYEAFCDPQVALVGGKILPNYMSPPPSWVDTFWMHDKVGTWMFYLSLIDLGEDFKDIPANYIFGANFSIRKTILLECKGFHPDAFPRKLVHLRGDGEYGLSLKIMKRGYRSVYHPRAIVKHTIPENRITPSYFCWRSFCQGISDSYTQIRRHDLTVASANRPDICAQMDDEFITTMLKGELKFESESVADVRTCVNFSYNQGWLYHRHRAKSDPKLLAYVTRSTYFSFGESIMEKKTMQSSISTHQQQCIDYIENNNEVDKILQNRAIQLIDDGRKLLGKCLFSDALIKFDEAMYFFPKVNGLQYMRALCLQSIGRLREAEIALRAELAGQPDFEPAKKMLRDIGRAEKLEKILAIPTKLTFDERLLLLNLAKQVVTGGVIVEIGSYIGASSCFLAEGAAERFAYIYCVDTWQNDAMPEAKRDTFDEFNKNITHYKEYITPMKGESVKVASSFSKEIDLLFIDADHSYEGCKEDIKAWLPKMKHNGTIIFHDYGWAEGIQRAVQDLIRPIESMPGRQLDSMYWTTVNKTPSSSCESKDIIKKFSNVGYHKIKSIADQNSQKSLGFEDMAISLYNGVNNDLSWVDDIAINLSSAVIYITDLCNSRCITCNSWKNKKNVNELDTDSWKDILKEVRAIGASSVEFVGGEPLIRKDLPTLAACAKELGFSKILLSTNGFLLNKDKFAKLTNSGINRFHISLDGMQNTYKFIRGVDWFDRVLSVCQMISDAGMPLMLLTNLVKHSIDELEYVAALAHNFNAQWFVNILENNKFHFKGINIDSIRISSLTDIERTIRILEHICRLYPQTSMLKADDIEYIRDFLIEPENEKDIPCTLGFNEIYFDALGNLYPSCMSLPAVGNAATEPSTQILHSSKYRSELKSMLLRRCPGCTCGYSQRAQLRALADTNRESSNRLHSVEPITRKGGNGMKDGLTRLELSASSATVDRRKKSLPQTVKRTLTADEIAIDPSSNGHLDSKVFWFEGQVYRAIKGDRANFYKEIFAKNIIPNLVSSGLIETEIYPLNLEGFDLVLKHRKLPFRSFSFEWPIKMLKLAALTAINLNIALAQFGLQSVDAHNQNIMFDGTDSIFIDFASIVPFSPDKGIWGSWYQELCEYFLYPLLLWQFSENGNNCVKRGTYLEISRNEIINYVPKKYIVELEHELSTSPILTINERLEFLNKLQRQIERIDINLAKTDWSDYNDEINFDFTYKDNWPERNKNIYKILIAEKPDSVLDIGSNRSWYGQLAANLGSKVVAFDVDEPSLIKLYDDASKYHLSILPLVMDITKPTPPYIYKGSPIPSLSAEYRFQCDTALAFALVHHLVFKQGLNFNQIIRKINPFVKKQLIIEFQPKEDKFVSCWWNENYRWYTLENFVAELKKYFTHITVMNSTPLPRKMISCIR